MIDERDAAILAAVRDFQRISFGGWQPRAHSFLVRGWPASDRTLADRARRLERRVLLLPKISGLPPRKGYVLTSFGERALQAWPGECAWPRPY